LSPVIGQSPYDAGFPVAALLAPVLEELQPAVRAATAVRDVRRTSEAFTGDSLIV
jgi:hypothetical protein